MPERSRPDSRHDIYRSKFDKWRFLAYNPGKFELQVTVWRESEQQQEGKEMKLNREETEVLEEFKRRVQEQFPGELVNMLVFGSKARGDAAQESDIDVIVITHSDDKKLAKNIRYTGYDLEIEHGIILSIQVYSQRHINYLRNIPTQFIQNIDREAISCHSYQPFK